MDFLRLRRAGTPVPDSEVKEYLTHKWRPPQHFKWPFEVRKLKGREAKVHLSASHFDRYPWLTYSISDGGLFCKVCAIFEPFDASAKRNLVNFPCLRYANLLGKGGFVTDHCKKAIHKINMAKAAEFVNASEQPEQRIDAVLHQSLELQRQNNRKLLKVITGGLLRCAWNGAPLRGHTDHGRVIVPEGANCTHEPGEGLFRSILRYRAEGDAELRNLLLKAPQNALMTSPRYCWWSHG